MKKEMNMYYMERRRRLSAQKYLYITSYPKIISCSILNHQAFMKLLVTRWHWPYKRQLIFNQSIFWAMFQHPMSLISTTSWSQHLIRSCFCHLFTPLINSDGLYSMDLLKRKTWTMNGGKWGKFFHSRKNIPLPWNI